MHRKYLLILLAILNITLITWFWYGTSGILLSSGGPVVFLAVGRLAGLLLTFFVLAQIMLVARIPWVERLMSFDRLTYIHHLVGLGLLSTLIIHPLFVSIAYARLSQSTFIHQWIIFLFEYDDIFGAVVAAALLIVVALVSIRAIRRLMSYEVWYALHLTVYVAVLLAFGHQLELGGDFGGNMAFVFYWYLLYAFVFGNLITYRFINPVYLWYKHRFRVDRVVREADDIVSIYITGNNMKDFQFEAGQFAIFRFLDRQRVWQAHPFSFSQGPNGKSLRITPKRLGDFTNKLIDLKSGTPVIIDGPHGAFVSARSKRDNVVCVAGGIGITPIRALLEKFCLERKKVILLYAVKTARELVFREEIKQLVQDCRCTIYCITSDDPAWAGLKGRIDQEMLTSLVPDIALCDVYVCGPAAMLISIRRILKNLGLPKRQVMFEKFAL